MLFEIRRMFGFVNRIKYCLLFVSLFPGINCLSQIPDHYDFTDFISQLPSNWVRMKDVSEISEFHYLSDTSKVHFTSRYLFDTTGLLQKRYDSREHVDFDTANYHFRSIYNYLWRDSFLVRKEFVNRKDIIDDKIERMEELTPNEMIYNIYGKILYKDNYQKIIYRHNLEGACTKLTKLSGKHFKDSIVTDLIYDKNNRLIKIINKWFIPALKSPDQLIMHQYNKNGHLIKAVLDDGSGLLKWFKYYYNVDGFMTKREFFFGERMVGSEKYIYKVVN